MCNGRAQSHALMECIIYSCASVSLAQSPLLFERRIAKNGLVYFQGECWEIPACVGIEHGQHVYVRPCPRGVELVVEISGRHHEKAEKTSDQHGQNSEKSFSYILLKPAPPRIPVWGGCHSGNSIRPWDTQKI